MVTVTNLWPHPSIEPTHDWIAVSGSTAPVAVALRSYVGTRSLHCVRGAGASILYAADNGFQSYITSGAGTYRLSLRAWIPSSVTGTSHGIRIAGAGTSTADVSTALRDQWAELTTTFVWDGVGALNLSARGDSADAQCWIDAVILTAGSDPVPYFDGDTAMDPLYRYAWSGTAHASASTRNDRAAAVKVEVAFNAGYRTPAASRIWTDVSAYVEFTQGIGIEYGRRDELATADANQLQAVFDNTDARFTWGNASSPYYPNVLRGRPIRVAVTAPFSSTRYTGFIEGWPTSWPGGSDDYCIVSPSASSRLARLGLAQKLRSIIEQEILLDGPVAYYTLGEPTDSTQASDSSGHQASALTAWRYPAFTDPTYPSSVDPVFGSATGPAFDSLTAAQFPSTATEGTKALRADGDSFTLHGIEFFFSETNVSVTAITPLFTLGPASSPVADVVLSAAGDVLVRNSAGAGIAATSAASFDDGETHHVFVRQDGANIELYADGVLVDSGALVLGNCSSFFIGPTSLGDSLVMAHLALYDASVSAARIAAHADAGLTGYVGETSDERLERYAVSWAHIPTDEVVTTASDIALDHIPSEGQTPLDLMRKVETSEAGVLHDDRDGKLTLRNRDARYGAAVAVTLDASLQEVGVDFAPTVDGQGLYNIGEGKNLDGTVTATHINEDSREEYGDHTYSVETASTDPAEPLQLAGAVVNANAEPRPRAASVTVDLNAFDTSTMQAIAALDVGSLIELDNLPAQSPGGTTSQWFVEGYSEAHNVGEWRITFNLSPGWPLNSLFVLDDATHGALDSDDVLAL